MGETKIRRVLVCAVIAKGDMLGSHWRYTETFRAVKEKQGVIALFGLTSEQAFERLSGLII
jgi:hypothetical protein